MTHINCPPLAPSVAENCYDKDALIKMNVRNLPVLLAFPIIRLLHCRLWGSIWTEFSNAVRR